MSEMNAKVTAVLAKEKAWAAEFAALRGLCLATGLDEQLKWGKACYVLDGANVVLIHGFKAYCALLFLKGALMPDPNGILVQQTAHVQSARQIRFSNAGEIRQLQPAITAYLKAAMAVEKSGAKVAFKTASEIPVPEEFQSQLDKNAKLKAAFAALTPGRQKQYLLFFGAAKQSATRAARVEKWRPAILAGRGMDDASPNPRSPPARG